MTILLAALAVVQLVTLHMVDGRIVEVNPAQIVQLVHPVAMGNKAVVETVKCIVKFTSGAFLSVAETCQQVQDKIKKD